jgi:hypothetical protein
MISTLAITQNALVERFVIISATISRSRKSFVLYNTLASTDGRFGNTNNMKNRGANAVNPPSTHHRIFVPFFNREANRNSRFENVNAQ